MLFGYTRGGKMNFNYSGPLKEYINNYIIYKKQLGNKVSYSYQYVLLTFDKYTVDNHIDIITLDLIYEFINTQNVSNNTKARIATILRGFTKYLYQNDIVNFILPEKIYTTKRTFKPYIFNDDEIYKFFSTIKNFYPNCEFKNDILVLCFLLLYCTGMRIGECLSIKFSDIDFTKRTIRKSKVITNAENAEDALRYSLNNRGCVDFEYMKTLYPKTDDEIIEELDNLIYQDPERLHDFNKGWVIASEYLSVNVKHKLNYAKSVNEDNKFDKNITALERVHPTPLEYDEISVKLGSTWIPEDIYHQFCCELLDIPRWSQSRLKIKYAKEVNTWLFQASGLYGYGVKNTNTWGTERADALSLIKNALYLQSVTVYDTLEDDRKVVNPIETANAREKQ